MSCRTQGDFRSSFHPSVCPEMANLKPARVDWQPEMADLGNDLNERADLRPEIADTRPGGWIDA